MRFTIKINLRNSILVAIFIALVFVIVDAFQECKVTQLFLNVNMKSSVDSIAQLFFDIGEGFNENDSKRKKIHKSHDFEEIRFSLPKGKWNVKHIRFDPLRIEGRIFIKKVQVVDQFDRLILDVDLKNVKARHQIGRMGMENDYLVVQTVEKAKDPILRFDIYYPFSQRIKNSVGLIIGDALKKFVVVFVLAWAAMIFMEFDDQTYNVKSGTMKRP